MKFVEATLYMLQIPFVEAFSHSARTRAFSDSIVVRLRAEDGTIGYGEGIARPYVTGETLETCLDHMVSQLWPAIAGIDYPDLIPGPDPITTLAPVDTTLPDLETSGVIAWNAARTAFELALIDTLLQRQNLSLAALLPPTRHTVIYSGIISTGSLAKAVQHARNFKSFGIQNIKIKIDGAHDRERVSAIRKTLGRSVSLRVDANGAYTVPQAIATLTDLAEFNIDSAEQPIPRGDPAEFARVKAQSPIPVMADESLVTVADARALIEMKACDFFNLRLSKCGGIGRTLELAGIATRAGLKLQLGCQVGETAILSAAGRHVAAYLEDLVFVEGSYGSLLLTEDVSENNVTFGQGGKASVLQDPGLGVKVCEDRLCKYAHTITRLGDKSCSGY